METMSETRFDTETLGIKRRRGAMEKKCKLSDDDEANKI